MESAEAQGQDRDESTPSAERALLGTNPAPTQLLRILQQLEVETYARNLEALFRRFRPSSR